MLLGIILHQLKTINSLKKENYQLLKEGYHNESKTRTSSAIKSLFSKILCNIKGTVIQI